MVLADTPRVASAETLEQLVQHLKANEISADRDRFVVGPWINLDPTNGQITGVAGGDAATLSRARALAAGSHRPAYSFDA
jgi:uncharacterized protein YerC